jgi:hypothetical protein
MKQSQPSQQKIGQEKLAKGRSNLHPSLETHQSKHHDPRFNLGVKAKLALRIARLLSGFCI